MPTKQDTRSNEERRRAHRAARQRQQKMRRRIFYVTLCLVVVIVGVILSLTVFFKVSKYETKGDTIYTESEIIAASGVKTGDNLFLLKESEISANISEKLPFVGSAKIKITLPDKLTITTFPTAVKSAVAYKDGFVLIDDNGKVLALVKTLEEVYKETEKKPADKSAAKASEKTSDKSAEKSTEKTSEKATEKVTEKQEAKSTEKSTKKPTSTPTKAAKVEAPKYVLGAEKLTIIKGFKVKSAVVGQPLEVSNEKAFSLYGKLMAELGKNKIDGITEIDLSDTVAITLVYQDRIKILLGSVSNIENKIALAQNVLKNQNEISPYQKGTVDLTIDKKAYFSPAPETTAAPAPTEPTTPPPQAGEDVTKNNN